MQILSEEVPNGCSSYITRPESPQASQCKTSGHRYEETEGLQGNFALEITIHVLIVINFAAHTLTLDGGHLGLALLDLDCSVK